MVHEGDPYFNLKAANSNIANFSSTSDETYILLIANDDNGVSDHNNNAAIIGANIINEYDDNHQAFIGIRENNINNVIATFNNQNILFKVEAQYDNDIIPILNTYSSNIGSETNRWDNVFANNFIGNGNQITDINLNDRTTSYLTEGSNRYYTENYFNNDLNKKLIKQLNQNDKLSLDNIKQGNINKTIQNDYYQGTLVVDNIIINNYDPDASDGFHIEYNINVTNTDQIYEGINNLYYTDERVNNIVNLSNELIYSNISNLIFDNSNQIKPSSVKKYFKNACDCICFLADNVFFVESGMRL